MSTETGGSYIVSVDTGRLMARWSVSSGFQIPPRDFFGGMTGDLESALQDLTPYEVAMFPDTVLATGLNRYIEQSPYPVVSLDRTYVDSGSNLYGFIDVTRAVDENLNDLGLVGRAGAASPQEQLSVLIQKLQRDGVSSITLVDDVVFNGDSIVHMMQVFAQNGITVGQVIAGIGIERGLRHIEEQGTVSVAAVEKFHSVVDEVCERDFTVGVPYSGRTLVDGNGRNYAVPYLLPFGKATEWASFPESSAAPLSEYCIRQSIILWSKIESLTQSSVLGKMLPRRVKGFSEGVSVVDSLRKVLIDSF